MYKIYQISMNDTLETIANRFNTTVDNLKKINGMQNDMVLRPGGFLVVPSSMDNMNNFKTYTVKKGDNMYQIAQNNNTDYKTLLEINGLEGTDYIYPDQKILIPNDNYKMYVTKDGDSITSISTELGVPFSQLKANEGEIYLAPDQLLIYR